MRTVSLTPENTNSVSPLSSSASDRAKPSRRLDRTLADVIACEPSLRRFSRCLLATGLLDDLDEAGPFSVFAPRDQALTLPQQTFETWFEPDGVSALFDVAEFHVVRGLVADPPLPIRLPSLEGRYIPLREQAGAVLVNGQARIQDTWLARNGVLHFLDQLLVPPGIQISDSGRLSVAQRDRPSGVRLIPLRSDGCSAENLVGVGRVE
ncbi:MAG: fasciclin domain-containing protein [Polyangiaceae bacterium]